ncbi:MAG: CDP-diacylglycerol--serine O-phosphatidyltransferase [Candidatus Binataceae bacterium]
MKENSRRPRTERNRVRLISSRIRGEGPHAESPLRRGVYLLPATVTSIGLLSGFYSIVSTLGGHFETAAVMLLLAFVCDGLDGRIARASRTSSQFGVEYDSLSDMVAFGVAPAILAYWWALRPIGSFGIGIAGLFVLCGALRLARFNVQTATVDKSRFVGLPIPGAAIMIAGIALAYGYFGFDSPRILCAVMLPVTLALGGLMISRVPYPSFKALELDKRAQIGLVLGMIVVAAMLFAMPQVTAFLLAAAYVLSGPFLMLQGEKLSAKVPVLRPPPAEKGQESAPPASNGAARTTRGLSHPSGAAH